MLILEKLKLIMKLSLIEQNLKVLILRDVDLTEVEIDKKTKLWEANLKGAKLKCWDRAKNFRKYFTVPNIIGCSSLVLAVCGLVLTSILLYN